MPRISAACCPRKRAAPRRQVRDVKCGEMERGVGHSGISRRQSG